MRKLLLALLALVSSINMMAADQLSVLGIPLTDKVSTFCKKIEAKGFKYDFKSGNTPLYKGVFLDSEAFMKIVPVSNTNEKIAEVSIFFKESDTWGPLEQSYRYYKNLYEKKYGIPSFCGENGACWDSMRV